MKKNSGNEKTHFFDNGLFQFSATESKQYKVFTSHTYSVII